VWEERQKIENTRLTFGRYGESYKVDIDSSMPASLSILAFEGATRRNKLTISVCAILLPSISSSPSVSHNTL
jgi:hypothetical protein